MTAFFFLFGYGFSLSEPVQRIEVCPVLPGKLSAKYVNAGKEAQLCNYYKYFVAQLK